MELNLKVAADLCNKFIATPGRAGSRVMRRLLKYAGRRLAVSTFLTFHTFESFTVAFTCRVICQLKRHEACCLPGISADVFSTVDPAASMFLCQPCNLFTRRIWRLVFADLLTCNLLHVGCMGCRALAVGQWCILH